MRKRGRRSAAQSRARHQQIIDVLKAEGAASITALAQRFECSSATIRRDIAIIQPQVPEVKKYHGVITLDSAVTERYFQDKTDLAREEKEEIARAVCSTIPDHSVIGVNGGTTTVAVAREMVRQHKSVTVVTNAINVALEFANTDLTVVVIGGVLRMPNFETTGLMAVRNLGTLHLDWAVLGANGVHPRFGVSTTNEAEASIGAAFSRHAERVMVVADHSKCNHRALYRMLDWTEVQTIVSDRAADPILEEWSSQLKFERQWVMPNLAVWVRAPEGQ